MSAGTPWHAALPCPTEEQEGLALFTWAQHVCWSGIPLAELLVHIPNGQKLGGTPRQRAFAMVRLKQQGFQVGASDYLLTIPALIAQAGLGFSRPRVCGGLWIELKRKKGGRTSDDQARWLSRMRWLGFEAVIAQGFDQAKEAIERYVRLTAHPVLLTGVAYPEDWPR